MKMSGAEIVIKSLEKHGIETVTGIPGGAALPLYNALYASPIKHVLARHEQGAAFIAQGMARSTGKAAVCIATSGPGATNLITAIADAKLDSIPVIAITAQVALPLIGTDAFQEVDMYGLTLSITKHSFLAKSTEELPAIMRDAFRIAQSGRPGPVVIDIPKDIQARVIEIDALPEPAEISNCSEPPARICRTIAEKINSSKRPVIYAGGGIIASGAFSELKALSEKNSIPAAVTLMGLGSYPHNHGLYLGMVGMHGNHSTNIIFDESDLIICIGSRFGDRTTGVAAHFGKKADIIHIDIDPSEINKIKKTSISLASDAKSAINAILPMIEENSRDAWRETCRDKKIRYDKKHHGIPAHPESVIREVSAAAADDAIITTDVGQHQMWVARNYPFSPGRNFLTSGGLGTMGFGLPAAIGAALANPDRQVICFSGDGSILMNIQELATLADLKLNVKIILFNNGQLGLVRQQQELFYNKNYIASSFTTSPDFPQIAKSFNITGCGIDPFNPGSLTIEECMKIPGPVLINVPVTGEYNVYPMVPPGESNVVMIMGDDAGPEFSLKKAVSV
ncbi:MAG TPA: biosynthetic-type acetolactate synthase large subunit [Spirochaetota bacterium]|nr:biosynthetic-type acetolactate synthase large subunit [Spirochaetota bacterium]